MKKKSFRMIIVYEVILKVSLKIFSLYELV